MECKAVDGRCFFFRGSHAQHRVSFVAKLIICEDVCIKCSEVAKAEEFFQETFAVSGMHSRQTLEPGIIRDFFGST